MLQRGQAWLSQKLTQHASRMVTYQRDELSVELSATIGKSEYEQDDGEGSHLNEALGDSLRIISVNRDIEASIRSLKSRSEKHRGQRFAATDEDCERLQRSLLEHRDAFIASHPEVPVFHVDFSELTTYPEEVINNLIEFLGIEPTAEEIAAAIDHVNPQLRKHG